MCNIKQQKHLRNDENPGCLGCIGDDVLPSDMGIIVSHCKDPAFFVAHLSYSSWLLIYPKINGSLRVPQCQLPQSRACFFSDGVNEIISKMEWYMRYSQTLCFFWTLKCLDAGNPWTSLPHVSRTFASCRPAWFLLDVSLNLADIFFIFCWDEAARVLFLFLTHMLSLFTLIRFDFRIFFLCWNHI